ncbi:putative glutamine amidotransferase [Tanacetum coccineum]
MVIRHSVQDNMEILVNSYHHQGVKRLAQRFRPMAFAPDGLVEGFYDPDAYNPDDGQFIIGLQFHPEQMRKPNSNEFNYPGCVAMSTTDIAVILPRVIIVTRSNSITKSNLAFNLLLENRLRQAGTTKNKATEMFDGEREKSVRAMMSKMTIEQLSDLDLFHRMRGRICSEMLLEKKQLQNVYQDLP